MCSCLAKVFLREISAFKVTWLLDLNLPIKFDETVYGFFPILFVSCSQMISNGFYFKPSIICLGERISLKIIISKIGN